MSYVADRVRRFILTDLNWDGDAARLTGDLELISERVLDSIGVLSLVSFLESEYGIQVEDTEIVPARLGTLNRIESYVAGKLGRTATAGDPVEDQWAGR